MLLSIYFYLLLHNVDENVRAAQEIKREINVDKILMWMKYMYTF